MADMQRRHGSRIRLQNTAKQIRLHVVYCFGSKVISEAISEP